MILNPCLKFIHTLNKHLSTASVPCTKGLNFSDVSPIGHPPDVAKARTFFPDQSYLLQNDCIYLARSEEIEKHISYFEEVNLISIGPLPVFPEKRANLSVIILPETENIIAVFNQVQDVFFKYEQWEYA